MPLICRFKSDYLENGPGFKLRYESTDVLEWSFNVGACGGNFTTPSGILTSPQHPGYYPNTDCVYIITQPEGNYVNLTFLMLLTHKWNTPTCKDGPNGQTSDYLEIRDGNHEKSPLLARVCGTELPSPILSTQNKVWMR